MSNIVLQLVKPSFDWGSRDKLTEIEQFKDDCRILFDGPLGIVNPKVVSVDAVKNKFSKGREIHDCNYCGCKHSKGGCPAFGKECNRCGWKKPL